MTKTHSNFYRTKLSAHTKTEIYDLTKDVISWSYSGDMKAPAGTFSLNLSRKDDDDGLDWAEKISAQDYIKIELSINGGDFFVISNCLVSRIQYSVAQSTSSGEIRKTINIAGSNLAKLFNNFEIFYNAYEDGLKAILGGYAFENIIEELTPQSIMQAFIDFMFFDLKREGSTLIGFNPDLYPSVFIDLKNKGVEMVDLFKFHSTLSEEIRTDTTKAISAQGSIWNAFKKFSNEPFTEMFMDNGHSCNIDDVSLGIDDKLTYLYLRDIPFDEMDSLVTHDLTPDLIKQPMSLGKGDQDMYSYYFAYPSLYVLYSKQQWLANGTWEIINEETVKTDGTTPISFANRFGLKQLNADSLYINSSGTTEKEVKDKSTTNKAKLEAQKLTDKLVRWFDPNPEFWNGNIGVQQVHPNRFIKMGHRARIVKGHKGKTDILAYITGVNYEWSFGGSFNTTLTLSRGILDETRESESSPTGQV